MKLQRWRPHHSAGGEGDRRGCGRAGSAEEKGALDSAVFEALGLDLEQLDRAAIEHLAANSLGGVEVDKRLVGERIAQDLRG